MLGPDSKWSHIQYDIAQIRTSRNGIGNYLGPQMEVERGPSQDGYPPCRALHSLVRLRVEFGGSEDTRIQSRGVVFLCESDRSGFSMPP